MKYLKLFKTAKDFETYYIDNERPYPQISFLLDTRKISYAPEPLKVPIKIVFYNIDNGSFIKTYASNVTKKQDNLIPIGVEVIPSNHNVYSNGKGGVISLKNMDTSNPILGTNSVVKMCWGPVLDISNMFNYTRVVVYDSNNQLSAQNFGYLIKNGLYNYPSGHIPSPFNDDFSRNADYYNTSLTAYNALSDFKGKTNTNYILKQRGTKDYSSWIPSDSVNDYPAASVCDMFKTIGTNQGDWYLPSAGELGYLMPFWDEVLKCFNKINEFYGEGTASPVLDGAALWTSSENAAKNARYVETNNGLGYSDKVTKYSCRAFIQI